MTEQKRKIDMHVSIATKILQEIKRREIDKLQDFEEEAMKGNMSNQTKQLILQYVRREAKESVDKMDKVRLCAIMAQCCPDFKFVQQVLKIVEEENLLEKPDVQFLTQLAGQVENLSPQSKDQQQQQYSLSSIAKQVTSGGKSLLENIGVLSKDKKLIMVNQVRQALASIVRRVPLQQGHHYINCATG